MSTRSQIRIKQTFICENKTVYVDLYHHHDGYPEGVGKDLLKRFANASAECHKLSNYCDIDYIVNELIKDAGDEYEFTAYNHLDVEYLYEIDCCTHTIRCWESGQHLEQSEDVFDCKGREINLNKLEGSEYEYI